MSPDVLKAFFRSAVFLVAVSVVLALAVPRESAEFVVSVCTAGIGLALGVMVLAIGRMTQ